MPFYATVGQISLLDELHESYSDARLMPFGAEGAGNTRIPLSPGFGPLAHIPAPRANIPLSGISSRRGRSDIPPRLRRGGANENKKSAFEQARR